MKPFLKWAGGKRQLLAVLDKYIPNSYNRYLEPFLGGGALFFHLRPVHAVISDLNYDLVETYRAVQSNVDELIQELSAYRNEKQFYYEMRDKETDKMSRLERAARFIYLNKTCFNGLYRVNKEGRFNVPYGSSGGEFLDASVLKDASSCLASATILHGDYLEVLRANANSGDLVFLDPPYYPVGKYADFKRYTKESFYHSDHLSLRAEFDRLVDLGCFVIMTNSDHPFIADLFRDYAMKSVPTLRQISSKASSRNGRDLIVFSRQNINAPEIRIER